MTPRDEVMTDVAFVRPVRKISWLNQNLSGNGDFWKLISDIQNRGRSMTVRNALYSMLCVADFLEVSARDTETFGEWLALVGDKRELLVQLASKGTQGNIPQRAAIVLDYIAHNMDQSRSLTIVELGCSGGLLGRVFVHAQRIFSDNRFHQYFWLKRVPAVPKQAVYYIGCDQERPDSKLLPFYIWNLEQRKKTALFMQNHPNSGIFMHMSIEHFLENHLRFITGDIILLTSFVLYQIRDNSLVGKIVRISEQNSHVQWIDLSRAQDFPYNEDKYDLKDRWIYLFHNGTPKAHIINGSDDCPDWRYL